jgi:hypothetical protein
MLAKDYIGYFYHHHNNDKCLFIDRTINHSDLTLRPIIDLILENKPECVLYNYPTEAAIDWLARCYTENTDFAIHPEFFELENILLQNNCNFYLVLGSYYPELYKPFENLIKNFKILYWPTYLISHTYNGLKDLYLSPRGLDGPMNVENLSIKDSFNKLYLNLNNKSRYHRCLMMDELYSNNLFEFGINSWNQKTDECGINDLLVNDVLLNEDMTFKFKYWQEKYMNVDGYKIKEYGFKDEYTDMITEPNCFMSLVGESSMYIPFVTEKTYRPILLKHPFLCYGAKNQNKEITKYGFELYDEIFDYDFDSKNNISDRIKGVINNLNNLKNENYYDLYKKIEPKLIYNKNHALKIRENDNFNPYVEFYKKYSNKV